MHVLDDQAQIWRLISIVRPSSRTWMWPLLCMHRLEESWEESVQAM